MSSDRNRRVCVAGSLYCFTFYLLLSTEDEINRTVFIFDKNINKSIQDKIPYKYYLDYNTWYGKNRYIRSIYTCLIKRFKYPELYNNNIYGLDFNWDLLRGFVLKYIEDAPFVFDIWETGPMYQDYLNSKKTNWFKRFFRKIYFGPYYLSPVGTSKKVTDIYTTNKVSKPYLENKNIHLLDWKTLWDNSTESKRKLILFIFDISNEDLLKLKNKNIILLTQAFSDDKMVTEDEQIEIYNKIISNYNAEDVVIKPHPRDRIDYKKEFPHILYFDKTVPMQLLAVLGVKFDRVVTVTSSSALSFGIDVQIDWYGGEVHPGILKGEGVRTLEDAKKNYNRVHGA